MKIESNSPYSIVFHKDKKAKVITKRVVEICDMPKKVFLAYKHKEDVRGIKYERRC